MSEAVQEATVGQDIYPPEGLPQIPHHHDTRVSGSGIFLPGHVEGAITTVSPTISPKIEVSPEIKVGGGDSAAASPHVIEVHEEPSGDELDPRDARIEELEGRIGELEGRLSDMEERLGGIETRLDEILDRLNNPEPDAPAPTPPGDGQPDGPAPPGPDAPTDPGDTPGQGPENPDQNPALDDARRTLESRRDALLEVMIRRKGRMDDRWMEHRREDLDTYNQALEDYRSALDAYILARRQTLEAQGGSEEDVMRGITQEYFAQRRELVEQEHAYNNELLDHEIETGNVILRPYRRLLRRWANVSTRNKILIGVGVGAGVALVTGTAGVGIAGLAAGAAAKYSLGLLNRRASLKNVSEHSRDQRLRRNERLRDIQLSALERLLRQNIDADAYVQELLNSNIEDIDRGVVRAQRMNRFGNAMLAASGVMIGLGAAGEEIVPGFNSLWEHGHQGTGASGTGGNSEHMGGLYFHGSGHEAAVRLPADMHLGQINGHDAIIGNNGNIVYANPAQGIWNHQGRLSSAAIQHLRSLGYKVTEGHNFYEPGSPKMHFYNEVS